MDMRSAYLDTELMLVIRSKDINKQLEEAPILYIKYRNPISGYSKAPWGLSVLPRVTGIFTGTTISPGG